MNKCGYCDKPARGSIEIKKEGEILFKRGACKACMSQLDRDIQKVIGLPHGEHHWQAKVWDPKMIDDVPRNRSERRRRNRRK